MFATSFNDTIVRAAVGVCGTVIFAGICLLGATAPAQASEAPRATMVSYGDLNLSNARGRDALELRIRQAARSVCETAGENAAARVEEAQCVRAAIQAAQARLEASGYQG